MTAFRRMEEIPLLKANTIYSTSRFRLVRPCFGCAVVDLLYVALSSDSFAAWHVSHTLLAM
jgi:hypothetical protein